jgi:hypothetical protein
MENELELRLQTPIEDLRPKMIGFNNEEIKKAVAVSLDKYNNIIYTDDTINEAKKDRAKLNNFIKVIDTERKNIKTTYIEPYLKFEAQIKEITELVNKPIAKIDSQIKDYEAKKDSEKKAIIESFYNEIAIEKHLEQICPLCKIWNEKWLNLGYRLEEIKNEIVNVLTKVENDLALIGTLNSKYELQMKDVYLSTLDLGQAISENNRLENMAAVLNINEKEPEKSNPKAETETETDNGEIVVQEFRVECSLAKLKKLKQFLKENNIKYGRVEYGSQE